MRKEWMLGLLLAMAFQQVCAQSADPVVMRIAGTDVTRSEFEYSYNKNNTSDVVDQKSIDEYVPMFVNYRLKVQAALDMKMDTLSSFQKEFRMYRDQQLRPLLVSPQMEEGEAKAYYQQMKDQLGGKDLRLPAHIFLRVPQNAEDSVQQRQKERADSVYAALKQGADFAALANQISEDPQSARNGGELMWCGPGQLIPDFEKVMYGLKKGELSEPFLSAVGYHIVRLNDVKDLEPYDTLRPQILRFLEQRGLRDRLAQKMIDSLSADGKMTPEEFMDRQAQVQSAKDSNLKYLIQEYHDGLLMYEYCKTQLWDPAERDTVGLEKFFKKNKKRYAWDKPHFYGMLYYAKQESDLSAVKKLVCKMDERDWTQAVRREMNKDSVMVRMEQRLFVKGENATLDSLVFKVKQGKTQPRKDYPYSAALGRKLKKGPKKWTEVSTQVKQDYQNACEEKAVEELRKRYEVVLNQEVLKTVNKH